MSTKAAANYAEATWRELVPAEPIPQSGCSAIYDPEGDRMIVFGGSDTWALALNGSPHWTKLAPLGSPPPGRALQAAAFDPVRRRMIIFSGAGSTLLNDVWALTLADPSVWSEISPTGDLPAPRYGASAVYDPARDRIVVSGGRTELGNSGEVWALSLRDSPAWTHLISQIPDPPPRGFHSAIYDSTRDRLVMFGGDSGGALKDDLWAWALDDSSGWTQLSITGDHPSRLRGFGMAYDPGRDQIVMVGGSALGPGLYSDDVWTVSLGDSTRGEHVVPLGSGPNPREGLTAIYDSHDDRVIVFGGWDGRNPRGDTWQLSLGASTQWTPIVPALGIYPIARAYHAAIYDPLRQRMIVFGGAIGGEYTNDVWALSLNGSMAWKFLSAYGDAPPPMYGMTAEYDPVGRRMLIFGGYDIYGGVNGVWALTLWTVVPTWSRVDIANDPPAGRFFGAAILDASRNRMVITGGYTSFSSPLDDVWNLDLGAAPRWSQVWTPELVPVPRLYHSTIVDVAQDRLLMFGGYGGWNELDRLNDCWSLALAPGSSWLRISTIGTSPAPRYGHTAIYDPAGDQMVVFDGYAGLGASDVWALSLGATPEWKQVQAVDGPSERFFPAAVYDAARSRMITFAGAGGRAFADAWALSLSGPPDWTLLSPGVSWPEQLSGAAGVLDSRQDQMILILGTSYEGPPAEAWALPLGNQLEWKKKEVSGDSPQFRDRYSAVFDPVGDRVIVFGGHFGSDPASNETWALSLTDPWHWTRVQASGTPPPSRDNAAAVYDSRRRRMLIIGGDHDYDWYHGDVWELSLADSARWVQLTPGGEAFPRRSAMAAVYDPARDRAVVFGGRGDGYGPFNELWELKLSESLEWHQLTPAGDPPAPRAYSSAIFDPVRDRMLVFGGGYYNWATNEVWEISFSPSLKWWLMPVSGDVPAGYGAVTIFDPGMSRMVMWGGFSLWDLTWPLPADVSATLTGSDVSPSHVVLTWQIPASAGLEITVLRRRESTDWEPTGNGRVQGTGAFRFEDSGVEPGTRYGYRLEISNGEEPRSIGETWVTVPRAAVFSLRGLRPNPAVRDLGVSFSLPSREAAVLDLIDVAGRCVRSRSVGDLGPGDHVVTLGNASELAAGVYLLRLRQASRSAVVKATVMR